MTPIVDPREERLTFVEHKVRELEVGVKESVEIRPVIDRLKRELSELQKELKHEDVTDGTRLDFLRLCTILEVWIPRRPRKYEEAYKAELSEYLRMFSTAVEEEPMDGITDILVEEELPIELKVNPTKGQYNELCGKLKRVVAQFGRAAVVVVKLSSLDRYESFLKIVSDIPGIRVFPKA